jgi:hypothetical protein
VVEGEEQMPDGRPNGMYFLTPVWGEAYTRLFLDVAVPSQLAPGNLPGLRDPQQCRYLIFTTPRDAEVIVSDPKYDALSSVIPVEINLIEGVIGLPHDTMSACFRRGIAMADERGAASAFLTPDLVCSDKTFTTLQRLVMQGWRVVHVTGIRLHKESAALALRERFLRGNVIAVEPRDLMQLALRNLHPLATSSFWEEGEDDLLPSNLYWRVGSEGILARCFHLHPILVFPERKQAPFFVTVDDDYVLSSCPDPSHDYVSRDSDEVLVVELSDLRRYFRTGMRKGSVKDVAFWAELAANRRHRRLIDVPIRLHTGGMDEALWREAERRSDEVVSQIHFLLRRSGFRSLWTNPQILERRLLTYARERRLGQPVPGPSLVSFMYLLGLKCVEIMTTCARAIRRIRGVILGPPFAPSVLNMSWLYFGQLSKDVRDTLAELDPDLVISADPQRSMVAGISSNHGMKRFGFPLADNGEHGRRSGTRLVDLKTGSPLPDGSVDAVFIDATLRRCNDLQDMLRDVVRVLKDRGRVAIKADRLARSVDPTGSEVYVTITALSDAMGPGFEIVTRRRQGRMGTAIVMILGSYIGSLKSRVRIPALLQLALVWALIPVEIIARMSLNMLGMLLNCLDTTESNYVSSIVVARKTEDSSPNA